MSSSRYTKIVNGKEYECPVNGSGVKYGVAFFPYSRLAWENGTAAAPQNIEVGDLAADVAAEASTAQAKDSPAQEK